MTHDHIKDIHPELFELLIAEEARQRRVINLIASENYASPAVLEALGTVFTNKYAEGQPGWRYYFGTENADRLESRAQELVLAMFGLDDAWSVNVQPYSGSTANLAVYTALLEPGDTVLAMHLDQGGHLTHGHPVSITGKFWNFVHYGVNQEGLIDYDEVGRLAHEHKPKMIVCGASAYSRTLDFEKFSVIAKEVGAYLMADVSHIAGLIAGGVHPSPFPHADVVTSTTHKTLRGPRAAFIISRNPLGEKIDKAVFPGIQGGPHLNQIFAMAVMAEEVLKPEFKMYAQQVVANAQTLARELQASGFNLISGGTDNHLMLVDLTAQGITGKEAGELLERADIIVNKNAIPHDLRKPWDPSGIRLGTPALTTQGMKEQEMKLIAGFIKEVLVDRTEPDIVREKVQSLTVKFQS